MSAFTQSQHIEPCSANTRGRRGISEIGNEKCFVLALMREVKLSKLKVWFNRDKLPLNLKKTRMMLRKIELTHKQKLSWMGLALKELKFNFLTNLTIDKLSARNHIKYVQTKESRSIAVSNKIKMVFDHKSLRVFYCSLVLPYLHDCAEVWRNNYASTIKPLNILQK